MQWFRQLASRLTQAQVARRKSVERSRRREPLQLEAMEPRILLSGDPNGVLTSGVLTGSLTDAADHVVVALSTVNGGSAADGGLIIDLTINGDRETFGTATVGVRSVVLDGLAGNDTFTLAADLAIPLTIQGGAGSDSIVGPDSAMIWSLTGSGTGLATGITLFDGIENLTGGTDSDQFRVESGGSMGGQIDGGAGVDTLFGPERVNAWVVSGRRTARWKISCSG